MDALKAAGGIEGVTVEWEDALMHVGGVAGALEQS